ncbi:hypothetical protein H5A35_08800 [Pectobacterium brasiliense]|uniref:hypothetical protein n=1 Tax=Pectobacterium brasiliense TaxID=180957 RepID=UPI0019697EE5|nr:hypothetical protein [Pectobacterium brasiliense]MBN3207511.1 hypothetical protein [Pectobacterium brasiliense]
MNNQQKENEKALIERLKQVTADQFVNFLSAKRVTTMCPMCGEDGQQVIDETYRETLEDMISGKPASSFVTFFHHQPAIPGNSDINYYYKMTCDNCGYITMHSVKNLLAWADNMEKQDKVDA